MTTINELFADFEEAAADPAATVARHAEGRKVIGCIPYYAPAELVHAAGMYPVELWGGDTRISHASSYYPAFYCSLLVTLMEKAVTGAYDFLDGVIIPTTCDGLRNLEENWKFARPDMPVMPLVQSQNRHHPAAERYMLTELHRIADQLTTISAMPITDRTLRHAIVTFNKQRALMREFSEVAAALPQTVTPWRRHVVYKAAHYLPVEVHIEWTERLLGELTKLDAEPFDGLRLVATGILLDSRQLLEELEHRSIAIVGDMLLSESCRFTTDAPGHVDPYVSVARIWRDVEGVSVAFDPHKKRGDLLIDLARERRADGVLMNIIKFCEEEEFDYPVLKLQCAAAELPLLAIETEHQDHMNEQAVTRIQAFTEMLV